MAEPRPWVSCVLLTHDRLVAFKESVACYCGQSYAQRDLVIVTDGNQRHQDAVERFTRSLGRHDVRTVHLEPGALSTAAPVQAVLDGLRGDVVCQWSDAERAAPSRLQVQVEHLLAADAGACLLADRVHFFVETRDVVWVRARTDAGAPSAFPDTLLGHRRDCLPAPPSDERLTGAFAPRPGTEVTWLDHAGPLVVRMFERETPDLASWREFSEANAFDAAFVDAHLQRARPVLLEHRLPRPFLVAARDETTDDPTLNWRSP